MYERICTILTAHLLALRRQAVEVAESAHQRDVVELRVALPVRQPNDRERMLHNMTNVPFRSWCPHCVSCKSHHHHHPKAAPESVAEREFPVIQLVSLRPWRFNQFAADCYGRDTHRFFL